jgi:Rap1a immunity proteins
VGAVEVLDDLGSDTKLFCPPETASILERVRVIVTYVEGVPKRMTDGFGLLANEAMANAWPCKS